MPGPPPLPTVDPQKHNPGPRPPAPGQLPNPYLDEFALATPATVQQLPALPVVDNTLPNE